MLNKLSEKAGLTTHELNIFVFLILIFSMGYIYKYYSQNDKVELKVFDYSTKDSLFRLAGDKIHPQVTAKNGEKTVDYKQEVLDFNTQNFTKVEVKKTAAEKSINLNTAGFEELVSIPGLGEKTAQKILEFSTKNGLFTSLEQLQDIKGIGVKKYNKISIYVFIE